MRLAGLALGAALASSLHALPARSAIDAGAPAQSAGAPAEGAIAPARSDEAPDQPERERRRILTLADGRFVRAKTRLASGAWERYADGRWSAVEGEVVRVRVEQDVERELERRRAGLAPDALAQRVVLASWMLDQGLAREGLAELERVLASAPDHRGALAALAAAPLELDLGLASDRPADPAAELAALLRAGAGGGAATREIAAARIGDLGARRGVRFDLAEVVRAELSASGQPSRRAFAALCARRLLPGELRRELSARALLDGVPDVRHASALALRDAHGLAGLGVPVAALDSADARLRLRAVEALDAIGNAAAVGPLIAHLANLQAGGAPSGVRGNLSVGLQTAIVKDYDVEIAQSASIGDPQVAIQDSGVVHDVRAQAQITREMELVTTIGVLERLTAATPGRSSAAWQDWWREHADAWNRRAEEPPVSPR